MIRTWLNDPDLEIVRLGVIAITRLVNDREYENLPAVYTAITPLVSVTPEKLQYELRVLVTQLARRSPTETAYFLRQAMGPHPTPTRARVGRRILPEFPDETQDRLKSLLTHCQGIKGRATCEPGAPRQGTCFPCVGCISRFRQILVYFAMTGPVCG